MIFLRNKKRAFLILILVFALLSLNALEESPGQKTERWAIIIGVGKYSNENISSLKKRILTQKDLKMFYSKKVASKDKIYFFLQLMPKIPFPISFK